MLRRKDPVPLYHQLELLLRESIENGRYKPGENIPTEKELQETFNVSRATVRTALNRLAEDGLLTSQRGRGTFVSDGASGPEKIERNLTHLFAFEDDLRRDGGEITAEVLSLESETPPKRISDLLDIPRDQEVVRLRRRGFLGGVPLWIESRFFHPRIGELVTSREWTGGSVTSKLNNLLDAPITGTKVRITAAAATETQADRLDIRPGDPVLTNEFTFVDANGNPVDVTRATFRADRYAFTFTAGQDGTEVGRLGGHNPARDDAETRRS